MEQEILNAFMYRHACKDFDTNKKVDEQSFSTILEAGHLSPSSFGFEPWQFIVVQNAEVREKIKEVTWGGQNQIPHSSHLVVYLAKKAPSMQPDSSYIQGIMRDVQQLPDDIVEMKDGFYRNFLEEDFALNDNPELMFQWACRQVYISLGNMMTVAAMLGIDSCPMEGFNANAMNAVAEKYLGVDVDEYGVACLCAFGYRVADPRPKTRQSLDKVVRWVK